MAESALAQVNRADRQPDPAQRLRFVTAASLFDGHDASINIMRRILQGAGAEVIHLGHNRSVAEVVNAALQEDAHGIAVSSYQGGHVEYFKYMLDMLRERGGEEVRVFGGGGGVIVPEEIRELHDYGITRIYSPEDGQQLGLQGMIDDMLERAAVDLTANLPESLDAVQAGDWRALSRLLTGVENDALPAGLNARLAAAVADRKGPPVIGITGTGGAGKSSLTDELLRRFRLDQDDRLKIGLLAIDPSRRRTGGALLGDRIRMNAIDHPNIFMRSVATRASGHEVPANLETMLGAMRLGGFDLIIVETSGIGQGDAAIVPFVDLPMYVMTPEFGAASQLEKIDMLDFAELVAINKFDRRGAEDAVRDVRKQMQRNATAFGQSPESMPVYGTIAARFNDDGVTALYHGLVDRMAERGLADWRNGRLPRSTVTNSTSATVIVPAQRSRYLAEIADAVRGYRIQAEKDAELASEVQRLEDAARMLSHAGTGDASALLALAENKQRAMTPAAVQALEAWPEIADRYSADELVFKVRDREIRTPLSHTSLSGTRIPKIALPRYRDRGDLLSWLSRENLPGYFPYTAGVFPF